MKKAHRDMNCHFIFVTSRLLPPQKSLLAVSTSDLFSTHTDTQIVFGIFFIVSLFSHKICVLSLHSKFPVLQDSSAIKSSKSYISKLLMQGCSQNRSKKSLKMEHLFIVMPFHSLLPQKYWSYLSLTTESI